MMRFAERLTFALSILAIVGPPGALVFPRIVGSSCTACLSRPKEELWTTKLALDRLHADCGAYPTTWEGLDALNEPPPGYKECWKGPYSDRSVENDYWGHPYVYESDGQDRYTLTSLGADGKPGGKGDDADLSVND